MFFEDNYYYQFIDRTGFGIRYLNAKYDSSKITKYVRVYYKDKEQVRYQDYYSYEELKRDQHNSIIVKYYVLEIDATNTSFDAEYNTIKYYNILNLGYFLKTDTKENIVVENEAIKSLIVQYDKFYEEEDIGKRFFGC